MSIRASRRVPLPVRSAAVGVAGIVTIPLLYLLVRALEAGAGAWARVALAPSTLSLLRGTCLLTACVVLASIAIALPWAWLVTRSDLPGRRFWAVAGALPLVVPSYIAAFSVVSILGPRGELASLAGRPLPEIAYGLSGAVLVLAPFTSPYLYLLLVAAMRGLDPALEESARTLGRSPASGFVSVVLPQLRGALAAGCLLVALYTVSDFGAISIVGYDTFTMAIYDAYRGLFDRTVAAMLATVLVALTLVLLAAEWSLVRRLPPSRLRPVRSPAPVRLGGWTLPALGFVGSITAFTLGVPGVAIGVWVVRGARTGGIGLDPASVWNSFAPSALAAVVAVLLSLPVAVWSARRGGLVSGVVERLTYSGYALPGMVIALALVFFAVRVVPGLYQTTALLVVAFVIRFLPEAVAATRTAIAAVSPVFEEAARSLGCGRLAALRRVTLPMIRPGLLTGGALVFLTAMKELPATLILRPAGFETLATRIWTEASLGAWHAAAAPALLLLAVSAVPVWALVIRPIVGSR